MPKVPVLNLPVISKPKTRPFNLVTRDEVYLCERIKVIERQIKELRIERKQALSELKLKRTLRKHDQLRTVSLYALRLEDNCWYVGISFSPQRRFQKHCNGKGAIWTKKHHPIEIVEIRPTDLYDQDEACKLEDDMTLEYALKYGSDYVRGGGYCQAKPHWPALIVENELVDRIVA